MNKIMIDTTLLLTNRQNFTNVMYEYIVYMRYLTMFSANIDLLMKLCSL